MADKRPSLKINAISNWVSLVVQVAVGFFLTPFVISHLGQSGYGIWVLVGSFIGYYGLLNLGVGSAISRYVARYSVQGDTKSLNETVNTALAMFCLTGFCAIIISFIIAEPLAIYFKIAPEYFNDFKHLVLILGIATGLSFPSGVFAAMIAARERYVVVNIVNILATLLRTGLTVSILLAGHGLVGLAYPALAATTVSLIAFIFLARAVIPEFRLSTGSVRGSKLKMLLVYGGFTTIIAIADILRLQIDSIVIGRMIGVTEVGIYGIAAILIRYMLSFVSSGMGVLTPRFASLDGANKKDEIKDIFLRALSISSFIACGITMLLVLFGRPFIFLWVGGGFAGSVPVLTILAVSYAFALCQMPGIGLMYALNKHRYYAVATMSEAIANVILSIVLVRYWGIIGVALGTAIPMLIIKIFIQPMYVSRIAGLQLSSYVKALVPAFVASIAITFAHNLVSIFWKFSLIECNSYFSLVGWAIVIGGIYYLVVCLLSPNIRRLTLSIFRSFVAIKTFLPKGFTRNT